MLRARLGGIVRNQGGLTAQCKTQRGTLLASFRDANHAADVALGKSGELRILSVPEKHEVVALRGVYEAVFGNEGAPPAEWRDCDSQHTARMIAECPVTGKSGQSTYWHFLLPLDAANKNKKKKKAKSAEIVDNTQAANIEPCSP
jgi:hypothetical protein